MKKVRNYRLLRPIARVLAVTAFVGWNAPPAAAFHGRQKDEVGRMKTQTPSPELRKQIAAQEAAKQPDVRELSASEMQAIRGRGYRNPYFSGVLPWQRSLRDVNLCNGN